MNYGARDFIHVQRWGDNQYSPTRRMNGRYKVFVTYRFKDKEYETYSVNSFNDFALAESEGLWIEQDGITDNEHGKIPPQDIVEINVKRRANE
jgi:hypothetical protein